MSRTRAALATVVLSALALGGCTDDDPDPRPSPPSSEPGSPSTSATAGLVEPTMPAAAAGTDAAAAEAFVKFYWEMVNYAQASGDVSGLEALADERCAACRAGVSYLAEVYQKDGRIRGGVGTVVVRQSGLLSDGDAAVRFTLRTTRQSVDYPGETEDESYPGGSTTINATLSRIGERWRLRSWSVEQ